MAYIYKQFLYSTNGMLTFLEGSFQVGAAGAVVVNSVTGTGILPSSTLGVQRVGTGEYLLTFNDDSQRLVGFNTMFMPPPSSSEVVDGSGNIITGKPYQITNASSGTNWTTLGLPSGLNPAVGMPFVATSGASNMVGSSAALAGNGRVAILGNAGFDHIEVLPNINLELAPTSGNNGSYVFMQTIRSSSGSNVGAPVNPTSGTFIRYNAFFRKTSVMGYNETTSSN